MNYAADFTEHPSIGAIKHYRMEKETFRFEPVKSSQVKQLLSAIKSHKSCGHDKVHLKLLRISASVIALLSCYYPFRWKMGQITSLFKKGDELSKKNYRPVTVLPFLNNICERMLSNQSSGYFIDILSDFISAYRKKTTLLRLIEDWGSSLDNKEVNCCCDIAGSVQSIRLCTSWFAAG